MCKLVVIRQAIRIRRNRARNFNALTIEMERPTITPRCSSGCIGRLNDISPIKNPTTTNKTTRWYEKQRTNAVLQLDNTLHANHSGMESQSS